MSPSPSHARPPSHAFAPSSRRGFSLFKFLLGLTVFAGVLAVAWVVLLPSIVVSTIRNRTGFAARVESLSVNPFTAHVHLRGLVLENPAGWPEKNFLEVRELRADAELLPLLRGRLVADEITVDVPQATLVRDPQGALNALVFKDKLAGPATPETRPAGKPTEKGPAPDFLIRRLNLRFGELVYVDQSGRKPSRRSYNLAISRELRDVDSIADLAVPFQGAAFGLVADLAARLTGKPVGLIEEAGQLLRDAQKKAGDAFKGLLEKGKP
jgi:hypothetical protein